MFKVLELLKATQGELMRGKREASIKGVSIDSRSVRPQEVFIAIKGENFDGHHFIDEAVKKGAKAVIFRKQTRPPKFRNKDIALIEVKDTVRALGDIARFHRLRFNIPVIAVTGSNGKTTTKEMIARVLSKSFKVLKTFGTKNNQIGVPLALLELNGTYDLVVLELGTNHFGEIDYLTKICQPGVGVITNIGPSHLENFKDLGGVFKKPGITILNADDNLLRKSMDKASKANLALGFGMWKRSDFFATNIRRYPEGLKFSVNQKYRFTLKTLGYYNIYNALAAIAVCRIFGMRGPDIVSRLASFDFPRNRLQLLTLHHTRFLDDSYNSNPLSLKQALSVLNDFGAQGRKIFIMGDMLELGERTVEFHRQIGKEVARICDVFIAVGQWSKGTAKAARNNGLASGNIFVCANNIQARDILFRKVAPGTKDVTLIKGSRAMRLEEILT
jgi:UDP-N-acetylmuramoyl-tripeptide--D-alanyl-D-alanine ligase